jgi:hypothetical protein
MAIRLTIKIEAVGGWRVAGDTVSCFCFFVVVVGCGFDVVVAVGFESSSLVSEKKTTYVGFGINCRAFV